MNYYLAVAVASFLSALILTWFVKKAAIARGLLDHPNARSSHSLPTPRGGGLAIVVAVSIGVVGLIQTGDIAPKSAVVTLLGSWLIATIGYLDDRGAVSVRTRFTVQALVAVMTVYFLGGLAPLQLGNTIVESGIVGAVFSAIAVVWVLNLYNFMDGIDGAAASEGVFIPTGIALISINESGLGEIAPLCLVIAAASLGFLYWNWPPAKIFMGDVGSGFLGYLMALIGLVAAQRDPVAVFVLLILGGVFFIDATTTLVRRLIDGKRVYQAHRSHAYQILSRRWRSHKKVTLAICAVNVGWLLPLAWVCQRQPQYALYLVGIALAPLTLGALWIGSGTENESTR